MRALMFGEDFTSDPVSRVLGYVLRYFSKGHLAVNVQLVSQVLSCLLPCLAFDICCGCCVACCSLQTESREYWCFAVSFSHALREWSAETWVGELIGCPPALGNLPTWVSWVTNDEHCVWAVQYLTLLFVGFISASSMRGFLHDMRKVRCQSLCSSNDFGGRIEG